MEKPLLRVLTGQVTDEELVALLTVVYARAARDQPAGRPVRSQANWRRPERIHSYRSPVSWQ